MNKINNFKSLLAILILSLTFSSCDGLLEVPSNSLLSDDVVFSHPDSANLAIGAIYDIIGQNNSYRNRLWLQMAINNDIEYRSGWSSGTTLNSTKSDGRIQFARKMVRGLRKNIFGSFLDSRMF